MKRHLDGRVRVITSGIPFTITIPWGKITPRGRTLPNTSHYYCHNVTYPLYFSLPFGPAHLCIYAFGGMTTTACSLCTHSLLRLEEGTIWGLNQWLEGIHSQKESYEHSVTEQHPYGRAPYSSPQIHVFLYKIWVSPLGSILGHGRYKDELIRALS